MNSSDHHIAASPSTPLETILADLCAANVRATPLNILARGTDLGLSETAIAALVEEMASVTTLKGIAA